MAATNPERLTILNVLRLYSTKTLKLNTKQITNAVNVANKLLSDTERIFAALENKAANQIETANSTEIDTLANLEASGDRQWRKESIAIKPTNYRQIDGAVYLPVDTSKPAPLIVIASGLNTDWQNFAYLAKHVASHGFGVATINFPGSDAKRINAVLNGLDVPPADNRWVEQPKVVTWLLNEIEHKSKSDHKWQGKLNLQKVGIVGQSLGGYTAMAVAGAKVDWQHLQRECVKLQNPEQINLNPALYLECQGATASPPNTDLQDKRVVAAIAINPVANPVFSRRGMNQLESSLMIVAGDKDLFAPALDEQIKPFSWLPDIDKYLVLVKNSTHFSFIGEKDSDQTELPSQIIGFDPAIARSYLKVLSVAFFESHLAQKLHPRQSLQWVTDRPYKGRDTTPTAPPQRAGSQFKSYLTETYVKSISKQPLPINLLRSLDPSQLKQLLEE